MSERLDLLHKYCSKAQCAHSQRSADSYWWKLKPFLTSAQRMSLLSAHGHWEIGEGAGELNNVRAEIAKEWESDVDS